MRLSDLLEMDVVTEEGVALGHVHDIRFTSATDSALGWTATSLVAGRIGFAARLGYAHGPVRRPWLIAAVLRWLSRHGLEIPWERIVALHSDRIVVSGTRAEFVHPLDPDCERAGP